MFCFLVSLCNFSVYVYQIIFLFIFFSVGMSLLPLLAPISLYYLVFWFLLFQVLPPLHLALVPNYKLENICFEGDAYLRKPRQSTHFSTDLDYLID